LLAALMLMLENVGAEAGGSSTTERPRAPFANSKMCYIKEGSSEKDDVFQFCSIDEDCKDSWLPGVLGSWSKTLYPLCLSTQNGKSTKSKTGLCCNEDALKFLQRPIAKNYELNCFSEEFSGHMPRCDGADDCKKLGGGLHPYCLSTRGPKYSNACCNEDAY